MRKVVKTPKFGAELYRMFESRRKSTYQVAQAAGITPSSVHFYTTGQNSPTMINFVKIINTLDLKVSEVMFLLEAMMEDVEDMEDD